MFVLVMIKYNNDNSQYKINDFLMNQYLYFFFLSFISIQLIEYFLWKNLNNIEANKIISKIGLFVILLQPFASIMTIKEINYRNNLLMIYGIPIITYYVYKITNCNIHTTKSKSGHLFWNWDVSKYEGIILALMYFTFFFYPMYYNKDYILGTFAFITCCLTAYGYRKDGSFGSMWCWTANTLMFYYLFQLLYGLPYEEYKQLC